MANWARQGLSPPRADTLSFHSSHLAHDLEWLEHEVSKDYSHAKNFIGDVFGHLEHVSHTCLDCLDVSAR
jgi:hypothetical protein